MLKYITQRIFLMLMTLLIITFICFILIRMLPPAVLPEGDPHTPAVEARREAMGYNKPYLIQFGIFLKGIFTRWDWGLSDKLFWGQEVADVFAAKLPATILVNLYSILLSIPVGIALGVLAALKKNRMTDHVISTLSMLVISVPSFVYAFLIQYFLSYKLGIFPFLMKGGGSYFSKETFISMIPPILALSFGVIAGFVRVTRSELSEVLNSDFMLLARAKGLTKTEATIRHALKNCMVVLLPAILGEFIGIMSGALIIEGVFAIPGVGSMYLDSINGRDYPVFMLLTVFYTFVGLLAGIVIDISYGFIDPRIRVGSKK